MRRSYDDFDEFDLEFADANVEKQVLREMQREQRRLASRRAFGPGSQRAESDYDSDDSFGDYEEYEDDEDYEDFEDYEDYDEDEFDAYSDDRMD